MSMTRNISMAIALAGLLAGASEARASTLIYVIDGATGEIWSYDSANGFAESYVATVGYPVPEYGFFSGAYSMSSGPAANTLYITASNWSADLPTYNLLTLDLTTGVVHEVGGDVSGNALGEGRDGWLYEGRGAELHRVNPLNGATILVGAGANGYAGDLAVDPTNIENMYGAVNVYGTTPINFYYDTDGTLIFTEYEFLGTHLALVDRHTGAQTLIGNFGLTANDSIWGLGFSLDGTLYATGPSSAGGETSAIFTINKLTGAATVVRGLDYYAYDMATQPFTFQEPEIENPPEFQPPGTGAVPEPMTLGLAGLGAAAAAVRVRRA